MYHQALRSGGRTSRAAQASAATHARVVQAIDTLAEAGPGGTAMNSIVSWNDIRTEHVERATASPRSAEPAA